VQLIDVFLLNDSLIEVKADSTKSLLFLFEKTVTKVSEGVDTFKNSLDSTIDSPENSLDSTLDTPEIKERIICHSDYDTWESVIEYWDSFKYPYSR
jgi:hypothetical protein